MRVSIRWIPHDPATCAFDAVRSSGGRAGNVLYLSYNGLTEPLGRRQVLPYVLGLAERGWQFTVISFEKAVTASPEAKANVGGLLREADIRWLALPYHRRPPVMSTIYDALRGWWASVAAGTNPAIIHARSTVPAAIARCATALVQAPWIFDVRGLLAREYADAGHWRRGGLLYRLIDGLEGRLMREADGLVFLTRRVTEDLATEGRIQSDRPLAVIPCCVDTEVFRPSERHRSKVREEIGVGDTPLIVYSGSLGSWYRIEEMLDFLAVARQEIPGLKLLILTPHPDLAQSALRPRPMAAASVTVRCVKADEVPSYLAAADAGLCFLGDSSSKAASSPTKYGEYLASGLPVITNRWTGDAASLDGDAAWLLIDRFDEDEYRTAAARLRALLGTRVTAVERARSLALRHFSLDEAVARYDHLYHSVLDQRRKSMA